MNGSAWKQPDIPIGEPIESFLHDVRDPLLNPIKVKSEVPPETYSGPENRSLERVQFTPEMQALADIIRGQSKCGDNCLISDDNKPHINTVIETVIDHTELAKKIRDKVVFYLVIGALGGGLTLAGWGISARFGG